MLLNFESACAPGERSRPAQLNRQSLPASPPRPVCWAVKGLGLGNDSMLPAAGRLTLLGAVLVLVAAGSRGITLVGIDGLAQQMPLVQGTFPTECRESQ